MSIYSSLTPPKLETFFRGGNVFLSFFIIIFFSFLVKKAASCVFGQVGNIFPLTFFIQIHNIFFGVFFEKNVNFSNLPYYIMFSQNCSKSQFTTWNPIVCHFFNKNQGSTLRFFSDFDQNSWFLNLRYYIMFYQNCSKSQFYHMKSHFVSFFNKNQEFFFFWFWSKSEKK